MAVLAISACACHNNAYTISGRAEASEGSMYLILGGEAADSAIITDGAYTFKGKADAPEYAYISDNANIYAANNVCQVYVEPGKITITRDEETGVSYAQGSVSNDAQHQFDLAVRELDANYTLAAQNGATQEQLDSIEAVYGQLLKDAANENIDNIFGLSSLRMLSYGELSADEIADYLAKFPQYIQGSRLFKMLKEDTEKALLTAAGQDYIDFTQADTEGKELTLSEVLAAEGNKYVLLDFWASWCRPCMGEVPYLAKTYSEYHAKGFEILGVSLDDSKEAWMDAITSNKMNWLHVSDLQGWTNAAGALYGINSIPANFLIDCKSGKIIEKSLRGEALEAKIAELLEE